MNDSMLLGLVQNASLLFSFSILYEYMWVNKAEIKSLLRKVVIGCIIGIIGIILMMTSWKTTTGIVFDTRSVVLSISGLFFGALPTIVAMIITTAYQLFMGGDGVLMGVAMIIFSGSIGMIWKYKFLKTDNQLNWIELLLMGFVVHIIVLFCTYLFSAEELNSTLSYQILPVLTLFPIVNMLLGLFMNRQLQNVNNRKNLSTAKKKYSRLYESMSDAYMVMDIDLNILECNKALQQLLGFSEEELLKVNCKDITPKKWLKVDEEVISNEVLKNGNSKVYEKECLKKDGGGIPIEIRVHLLKDEYEKPKGYWAIIRDISLRKNAIQQIYNERARLETILETVPEMIWLKDCKGKYLNCNKNFADFIGVKEESLIGHSDHDIYKGKEIADFYYKKDLEVIESGSTIRFVNIANSARSDKEILTETIKTPMYDSKGEIVGVLGVSRDITEIKKAEEELRQAKEKAEESDKLKSIFLANMSHEIRTPMNAIMGFTELIIDSDIEQVERMQYVNIIQQSGSRLLQIIDDIVDLSKLEMNQIAIKKSDFNLVDLIKESIDINKNNELIKTKPNLKLAFKVNPMLADLKLYSDGNRIQQILDNLIDNSIKFSESGTVEVGCNLIKEDERHFVEVYVKDEGIGIPEDRHEIIFERFRQGDEEHFIDGTGLGLSICKGLVDLLGGKIRFESEFEIGSTFYFTIPVDKAQISQVIAYSESLDYYSKSKKILVAENDYNSFLYVKKLLVQEGLEVIYAENCSDMLEKVKSLSPDLLIMDLNIPGKNTMTCLNEITKSEKSIKIIAQTAMVLNGEEERCFKAGCHGYITKPFSKEKLCSEVRKVLT
ncbi:PAS domain S-box protein [Marinifilum sp.]|uniref:PAS domain S-box protein n=1 Tax=Marinifilum sp. TaxID=2033137 RepID=UPI003BAB3A7D